MIKLRLREKIISNLKGEFRCRDLVDTNVINNVILKELYLSIDALSK